MKNCEILSTDLLQKYRNVFCYKKYAAASRSAAILFAEQIGGTVTALQRPLAYRVPSLVA
jgi:hypothetical protein